MNVYFISGIGADRRIFKHIRLIDGYVPFYLEWISPIKGEPLTNYAKRMGEMIPTGEPFVLIGLSLGGIVATEIANSRSPAATILIGSVPISSQLPFYYRFARRTRLLKFTPPVFFKYTASLKRLMTRETWYDKRDLLGMIWRSDSRFIRWGMLAVLEWKNSRLPDRLWHLHGTRDEVFPIGLTNPTHIIARGDHMLVTSRSQEVNEILEEILRKVKNPQ